MKKANLRYGIKFYIYLALMLLVMVLIFLFSAQDAAQSNKTSDATLAWFSEKFMGTSATASQGADVIPKWLVRKLAHFILYFCLGVTSFLAGGEWAKHTKRAYALRAWLIAVIYACTDELHQYFVPGRSCELKDVCIDGAGAFCGILFAGIIGVCVLWKRGELCSYIPQRVSNRRVVAYYEAMRFGQRAVKKSCAPKDGEPVRRHLLKAEAAGGYIEDQNCWVDVPFGKRTIAYAGCEVIAAYNALVGMQARTTDAADCFLELIRAFEADGMAFSGRFGTSPKRLADYFSKRGYQVAFTTDEAGFDAAIGQAEGVIVTFYNDGADIRKEIHTVWLLKENGRYTAHNVYGNGQQPKNYASVAEFLKSINQGRAKGICVTGIGRNEIRLHEM